MLWTGYLAVVSWLISLEQWVLVSIWIGAILGLESGRRSEYPTVMIMLCGAVLGSLFCLAFVTTRSINSSTTFASIPVISLSVVAWITVLAIAWWLFIGIRKKSLANKR
jgi:hypothetical protein